MYDDILIPTDGGEGFGAVLDRAVEIAPDEATVHVLYVVDDRAFLTLDDEMKSEVLEDLQAEGTDAVGTVADEVEAAGLDAVTAIRRGTPADEIVAYAEQEGVDVVTMGTRGDDYTQNILGSTAEKVVADASIPVLTVDLS
ncbi:universal stress protein [Halorientalis regularis]|jgi:nucleotide-binding universal stress UspA family protein|uniref:Nucleotide-binding universal stress protein, UspA family n=1 Tax=Halorientalis regularis TaxID=660518 RepID=A0A1G7FM20_9EURY|nr:universal stress protein [Halorientalis regularis]SDE76916.1 Nucleotide-binding universal stress protein, UspA family [Halorientalis regularis]